MVTEYRRKQVHFKREKAVLMDQIDAAVAFIGEWELRSMAADAIRQSWDALSQPIQDKGEGTTNFLDILCNHLDGFEKNPTRFCGKDILRGLKKTFAPLMTGQQLYDYEVVMLDKPFRNEFTITYRRMLLDAHERRAAVPLEDDFLIAQEIDRFTREVSPDIV